MSRKLSQSQMKEAQKIHQDGSLTHVIPKLSTIDYCQRQDTKTVRLTNIAILSSEEEIEHLEFVCKQSNLGY